ncbi:sugar transferase [Bacillus sp. UMB0893]|uniref:sugar transferase n=1 Tax=Bacillus sp. UMB0893 TaxID=2066053 RepID=UPI0015DE0A15|nr:sugar transferase [Bacillus sp. UMB0893]
MSNIHFENSRGIKGYSITNKVKNNSSIYLITKRFVDIFSALLGLIFCFPIIFVISAIFLFERKKGSVFFKQIRVGKDGKKFFIYKFRSMAIDSEERLRSDKALYEKYVANNYKLEQHEDPRITKLGAFLRKTSLDEIPQFFNVLKGDMSLIGPRPVVEKELEEYGDRVNDFLSVKPGLTGFWQVSGRSDVKYPERVDLELYYVYNQSSWFDLKILFLTIWIVLLRRGAY